MPFITIASFNIEKNGQSSEIDKQSKVSEFVDRCINRQVDIIYLCEVHSARINDYVDFIRSAYGNADVPYSCDYLAGGYSNAYVLIYRSNIGLKVSQDMLKGLNRGFIMCHIDNGIVIGLAHFKSGQTGLTRKQLEEGADFLAGFADGTGRWVITGDMNWDLSNFNQLKLPPNTRWATCWSDETQKSGGILDWCLAGSGVKVEAADGKKEFSAEYQKMDGPDHKPTLFQIRYP